jgi:pyruvate ferredoxin oxidoreductase alpha subunit
VAKFLPPFKYPLPLNPEKPVTMGALASPFIYTEVKWAQEINLEKSKDIVLEAWQEFGKTFGRSYSPIEQYQTDGAEVLLLTMGSYSETATEAVDKLRKDGKKVGLLKLRLWRPFPYEELRKAVKSADVLIVLDRAISFGGPGGPVCSEVKAALYSEEKRPKVVGFVGGLGGRDISVSGFEEMVERGIEISQTGSKREFEIHGVRK